MITEVFFDVLVLLTPALAHARLAVRSQGLLVFALVLCNSESAGGRSAMGGLLDNCYFFFWIFARAG